MQSDVDLRQITEAARTAEGLYSLVLLYLKMIAVVLRGERDADDLLKRLNLRKDGTLMLSPSLTEEGSINRLLENPYIR